MQKDIYTLVVMYKKPESPEEFIQHYLDKHIPLARKLPGLIDSKYSLDVVGITEDASCFCIWEGNFDSPESIANAMGSDIGQQVQADAESIATGGLTIFFYKETKI